MDRRREMARRLGAVLLVVILIAALVGVFAGDGLGEGDSSVVGEERQAEGGGRSWFWDAVNAVSALAVIVIGVATVWVMITQRRQSSWQARWQKEFGERQQWMAEGGRKLEVVKGVGRFYEKLAKGRGIKWWDVQELVLVEIPTGLALFKGKRRRFLLGVAVKAKEWWETEKKLAEEGKRGDAERNKRELEKWFELSGEEMGELAAACWEERG